MGIRDQERTRNWTQRNAERERVSRRMCLSCRRLQENQTPSNALHTIETGEQICDECLKRTRRRGRDLHIDVWVDKELDEQAQEVVFQSFRYLSSRLNIPTELVVAEAESAGVVGLRIREMEDEETDASSKKTIDQ